LPYTLLITANMGEETHTVEPVEALTLSKTISIPPPANPETMVEKIHTSQPSETGKLSGPPMEKLTKQDTEPEHPSMRRVIPIVAALYMAFFLVALVSRPNFQILKLCSHDCRTAQ